MAVSPVPDGYHTVTPYLVCQQVEPIIEFAKKAFGAEINGCLKNEDGSIRHAEVQVGSSAIMIGNPGDGSAMPCMLYLYVTDADAVYERAVAAGAESVTEPTNMFYGDRNAAVRDSAGNQWWIASRVEELTIDELQARMADQEAEKEKEAV